MENLMGKLNEAKAYIEGKTKGMRIDIGLVLGSGLGDLADEIKDPIIINYKDIPNFPVSTVQGHAGRLVIGALQGKNVLCMQGRFHYYEGYGMDQVVFPIQVMRLLGPRYKRPKKVIFADVPRNPTGKIEKPKLREMYGAKSVVAHENEIDK